MDISNLQTEIGEVSNLQQTARVEESLLLLHVGVSGVQQAFRQGSQQRERLHINRRVVMDVDELQKLLDVGPGNSVK